MKVQDGTFQVGDRVTVRQPETLIADIRRKVEGRIGFVEWVFRPAGGRTTRCRVKFPAPTPRHKEYEVVFIDRDLERVE